MSLDPDRVRARLSALRQPGAVAALEAECRAAVASEEWRAEQSDDHHPESPRRAAAAVVAPGTTPATRADATPATAR